MTPVVNDDSTDIYMLDKCIFVGKCAEGKIKE